MKAFLSACLDQSRVVLLSLLLIFVAGIGMYINIPKESNPDVPIPYISVMVSHEGISPEDAERLLARPLEQALRGLEGVKNLNATAGQNYANLTLEFEAGTDNQKALREVRRKVDETKGKLPEDSKEPVVSEFNVALFPVLNITLSGALDQRTLLTMARTLKDELLALPGVLEVDIGGNREDLVEIVIDPVKMESYGLTQEELFTLFTRNNRLIAAGVLDNGKGRFAVKLPGVLETLEDMNSLPVKVVNDRVVKFGDVATVTRTYKDPTSFARLDGKNAVTLEVRKRLGANIINTIDAVKLKVAELKQTLPSSLEVSYSQDESMGIREMLNDLQNGVLTAVILVLCVIIGILGTRSALLVAVSIPGSFLAGILVIGLLGYTVNVVVLFALIMSIGMLVDDSIVIVEYADRKMCEGVSAKEAYREATLRMVWPVTSSTFTRLVAFAPMIFWPGITGGFMKYLPITLIVVLTASLVMALVYVPVLGGIFGKLSHSNREEHGRIAAAEHGDLGSITGFTGWYIKQLTRAVDHPRTTFWGAVGAMMLIFVAYSKFNAGLEFFPNIEPDNAQVKIHARGDLSVYEKDQIVREVEKRILGVEGIKTFYTRSGSSSGQRGAVDQIGSITLELKDWYERPKAALILEDIRKKTDNLPGVVVNTDVQRGGPSQGKPISIELIASLPGSLTESNQRLIAAAEALRTGMKAVGGFIDIEDTRPLSGIEWQLQVNRAEAAKYGADIAAVGSAVQMVTNGIKLGDYRPEDVDDEVDIRARYRPESRNLGQLEELRIMTRTGLVPIANFVERKAMPKVGTITRNDSKRIMKVEANVAEGFLADSQLKKLQEYFQKNPAQQAVFTNNGVKIKFKGENADQQETMSFLLKALVLAVFLMLGILMLQFNSFYQAGLVLSAVLFSTAAVLLGLMLMRKPFGVVMGGIGVIALAGVIVNNNIILIDTYNHLRAAGMKAREAVLRTGAMRMRPVLLTAGTAILGLLPMAFGINPDLIHRVVTVGSPGAQWWILLASAVAGGLAFATPITLILTPALLHWRELRRANKAPKATETFSVAA
jgi:multidrug efflux pump